MINFRHIVLGCVIRIRLKLITWHLWYIGPWSGGISKRDQKFVDSGVWYHILINSHASGPLLSTCWHQNISFLWLNLFPVLFHLAGWFGLILFPSYFSLLGGLETIDRWKWDVWCFQCFCKACQLLSYLLCSRKKASSGWDEQNLAI